MQPQQRNDYSSQVAKRGYVEANWNVMAHAQKSDFFFRRNGRVHLNRRGRQFSRLLAAELCATAVAMLDTPCSEVVWRVLATHCIRQFTVHFPSRASPCAITFQLESNSGKLSYLITFKYKTVLTAYRCVRSVRELICSEKLKTCSSLNVYGKGRTGPKHVGELL